MKKTIYHALFGILAFLTFSCGNSTPINETASNSITDTSSAKLVNVVTDSAQMTGDISERDDTLSSGDKISTVLKNLITLERRCTESTSNDTCADPPHGTPINCKIDFCKNEAMCATKLMCCHRIGEGDFDALTANKTLGHARFFPQQLHNVVAGADCNTDFIEMSTLLGTYYMTRVTQVDSPSSTRRKSFYSAILMAGIDKRGIDSVVLYKGKVFFENGSFVKIVPFIVYFSSGTVEFFDVSNDHP